MANRVVHQDIVKKLLDSKTVDFNAIGKIVADVGPTLSLADEPWEGFCSTMRTFVHLFVLPSHGGAILDTSAIETKIKGK